MKTTILFTLLTSLLSVASPAQDTFKIIGQLGGTLSGNLMLVGSGPEGAILLDEAVMVDGEFEFTGSVSEVMPVYILTEDQQPIATIMLENLEYTLIAGVSGIEVLGGGESQKIWNEFEAINSYVLREKMKMDQEARDAYAQQNQMKLQALQQQFGKVAAEAEKKQMKLFETYKDSFVSAYMIASGMGQMDFVSLQFLYEILGEPAKNSPYGQMISQKLDLLKQVEIGSIAPNFEAATLEGNMISLHGVEAKLKLIDFWASWCMPCRQEMPNISKVYKKYQEQGLEIIGVSLDDDKDKWAKAIKEDKMTWINISDLKGGQSDIAALYFVHVIPHTLLLDENNRILAKNLIGKELEKKIAEFLKE